MHIDNVIFLSLSKFAYTKFYVGPLTQQDINLVLSHINSYKRRILGDKSPFEMFTFLYGEDLTNKLLRLLCLDVVPCNQIILKPKLLAL